MKILFRSLFDLRWRWNPLKFSFLTEIFSQRGELRKQVSFENSLDEIDQQKLSQVNYRNGRATTSVLSDENGDFTRKRSVTSNTSTATSSSAQIPDLKYILIIWSLAAVYTMIDEQLVRPASQLCSVGDGNQQLNNIMEI